MGHLIADAVGAPAKPKLGEIAGAEHDAPMMVGEAEEVVGAEACLHVLEGNVVDRFASRKGMFEVGEHLLRRRTDVELVGADPHRLHEGDGVPLRLLAGGKSRHGVGEDVLPVDAEAVERPCSHDQRLGGIEPAGNPDHELADARRLQPLHEAGDLDVVGFVAVEREARRIGRHEGEAL